ncbi:hypothetical protein LOTGIDRAFT_182189 [Lottia gigantea]|uniref:Uncharacterized protein n=1 Tax=Lottia gigantea TaxID=225164 RepID=V4AJM0_LOTGI|nr:hypothetical protein LOTGIDRAFT_182189 [Lottia gigantea]ESO93771.1 hypothetical protein LOTGIDRAFT_182189 [Lottia gigantea]
MASKKPANKPNDIEFDDLVVNVCYHPSKDLIAIGSINGDVDLYTYKIDGENKLENTYKHHKKSCRALKFNPSGNCLITASKDKSIKCCDLDTGQLKNKIKAAHESPIYCLLVSDENIIATGDDDGRIKVWDLRKSKSICEFKENDEYISDMVVDSSKRTLLSTSGEGTLTAFDIRKRRMTVQSEVFDSELQCLAIVKGERKVVCGSGDGALNIFNWNEWGLNSDLFPGHTDAVDCLVPINRNIVCTGSSDGIIRGVNILPNSFMGIIGEHDGFPIEGLSLSHDRCLLASCSHDQCVKFWNIEKLEKLKINKKRVTKYKTKKLFSRDENFFADINKDVTQEEEEECEEDDEDDDSDSDSD